MRKILKFIITLIILAIIFVFGYMIYAFFSIGISEDNNFIGEDLASENKIEKKEENQLLFLFTGVDSTKENNKTRTDTIMLILLDKEYKTVDIVSIPRDTRVFVEGSLDKINSAHSYGGMGLTIKTIRNFLGIDLDYFIEIGFDGVENLIDSIGGIEVDVAEEFANSMGISKGKNILSGKEALSYLRFREGYINQDLGRINTQQEFLRDLSEQIITKKLLKNPKSFLSLTDDIETNIPKTELISFALSLRDISSENIRTYTIPGNAENIDSISYFIANPSATLELINTVFPNYVEN